MSPALALITPATLARPKYLEPIAEPGFGSTLTRICGDVGTPISFGDTWGLDARHHYSRDQPWNCDGTLAKMQQKGGTPSKWIVDARTWKPLKGSTGNFRACTEVRWHPTKPTVMVGYNKNTREVVIFDALTNVTIKRISVPFVWQSSNGGFMGEGSLSNDGSIVCFGDEANNVIMIDITNGRVGPVQKVDFVRAPGHALGNITVSPLSTPAGGYVVAKASNTPELVRVFTFGADLILKPHFESDLTLSHGDVGVTLDRREVFCGGSRAWYGAAGGFDKRNGRIAAIFLDTGEIRQVSSGPNEASDQHCSLRGPVGVVLVTYVGPQEGTGLFGMELVSWPLDGSRVPVRWGVTRTNETVGVDPYRNEAHGVMRPDGGAVMFASNWQHAASVKGNVSEVRSFVLTRGFGPPPPPPTRRYVVDQAWTMQGGVKDTKTGRIVTATEGAELLNKWVKE